MSKIPKPNASLDELRETWGRVMEHMPQLRRAASAMAHVDRRLDPDELLADSIADIVDSEYLYREADAAWITWAKTRVWKTRTLALRSLNKHAPRGRLSVGIPDREDSPNSPVEPALGLGQDGTAERAEARIAVGQILDDAWDHEQDAMLVLLYEWNPSMAGGRKAVRSSLTSLQERVQDDSNRSE